MNQDQDVRWVQRFNNYSKALAQLTQFIEQESLNELEEQGLIQAFEYTFELAWNTLKDYLESQGEADLFGSRDVIRMAFKRGLITEGEIWMDMIKSRTLSSHTYHEEVAQKIVKDTKEKYFSAFNQLHSQLQELQSNIHHE